MRELKSALCVCRRSGARLIPRNKRAQNPRNSKTDPVRDWAPDRVGFA